jgi:hypothetical protein
VGADDDQFNVTADVSGASAMDLNRCEMGADGMLPPDDLNIPLPYQFPHKK